MLGSNLGNYRIVKQLGQGGMGAVYLAILESIERLVAIKVLHAHLAGSPEFVTRFLNEAKASNRVIHPGLVQITDYGQSSDGSLYIAMEYLAGELLSHRLMRQKGLLNIHPYIQYIQLIASALAAAHQSGIVHRDLKPDNIMIVSDPDMPDGERTKIMDFGIARLLTNALEFPGLNQLQTHLRTRNDVIMGTPSYMAPEQCRESRNADAKSDIYALGVILYQMLCGRLPFIGSSTGEILAQHIFAQPPDLRSLASHVPHDLSALVHQMLNKDPQGRPSAPEVKERLQQFEQRGAFVSRNGCGPTKGGFDKAGLEDQPQSRSAGSLWPAQAALSRSLWSSRRLVFGLTAGALFVFFIAFARSGANRAIVHWQARELPARPLEAEREKVEILVMTQPPGAQIISQSSGKVVGTTPWRGQQREGSAVGQLILRLSGYQDEALEVPMQKRDVIYQVHLQPVLRKGTRDDYSF